MLNRLNQKIVPNVIKLTKRSFLSESYKCTEGWNARLATPIMEKVKLESFYHELDQKFQQIGKVSAIDIDIFANKISTENFTDELADLVHKLRLTEETSNALESMGHALIRTYLEQGLIKELLDILNDRLSYGIFLDSYTANLTLDHLIKAKDFKSAARIATFCMLQEDFENPITRLMSMYACWKFSQKIEPFEDKLVESTEEVKPTVQSGTKKKKSEEVKVRIKFLRNPFFDDHLDLVESQQLVGKTLLMIGKQTDGALGNSAQLIGFCLYGKYDEGIDFLSNFKGSVYKDVVTFVEAKLKEINQAQEGNESLNKFMTLVNGLNSNAVESDFEKDICKLTNVIVAKYEKENIEEQLKTYSEWLKVRDTKLSEELQRLDRARRLADIEKITKDLEKDEEKLWFFENEDKIDLQIDKKRVFYKKRWFGKKKKPRTIDAGYVPPEIR